MPFRSNFFGDKYAQPGTTMGEIDDLLSEKYGEVPEIYNATLYSNGGDDENPYKFGGRLSFNALPDDDDTYIEDLGFDGFASMEEARRWLIDEISVDADEIEVEG